jgi:protein TonB
MHAMLDLPRDESRFIAASVAASVALHAAVLALGPRFMHEHPFEPPQVLSVVLQEPVLSPAEAVPLAAPPPPPPPPALRPAARPPPRIAPAPPPPAPAPPAATAPAEASRAPAIRDSGAKEERPAADQAPAAPPGPAVAAVPREPSSPPDFRAAYLRNPPPGYPAAARRNGEEGTVMLRVLVSAEGAPREVALERSSGSSVLDAAALATVKTWRFSPARRGGEPQEAWVLVPIVFRLEPRG